MSLVDRDVARLSWWQVRHTTRFYIVLALCALPLVAGAITLVGDRQQAADDAREGFPPGTSFDGGYLDALAGAVLYSVLPLTALLLAGGLVADEVEDRTLSYLLVRPIRRSRLYVSKLAPIALATAVLGAIQALGLGLMRLLAWALYGQGARERVATDAQGWYAQAQQAAAPTVDAGAALALAVPGGVLTAFLLGGALAALFGFVSLAIPRFHFVANLLVYIAVEAPFSMLGAFGLGFFVPTLHAVNFLGAFDLTRRGLGADQVGGVATWVALPMLLALTACWVWLGMRRARTKDFNITSAAA